MDNTTHIYPSEIEIEGPDGYLNLTNNRMAKTVTIVAHENGEEEHYVPAEASFEIDREEATVIILFLEAAFNA